MDEWEYLHLHLWGFEIFEGMAPVYVVHTAKVLAVIALMLCFTIPLEWRQLREKFWKKKDDQK